MLPSPTTNNVIVQCRCHRQRSKNRSCPRRRRQRSLWLLSPATGPINALKLNFPFQFIRDGRPARLLV